MKILVLSNTYPPYITGGYEIACYDNVNRLLKRGHEIRVLTSTYRREEKNPLDNSSHVYRKLWLTRNFYQFKIKPALMRNKLIRRITAGIANHSVMFHHLHSFRPDIIFCWNLGAISSSILIQARILSVPIVFYLSDKWYTMIYFSYPERILWKLILRNNKGRQIFIKAFNLCRNIYRGWPERLKVSSINDHLIFCSHALIAECNMESRSTTVIYHGVDTSLFYPAKKPFKPENCKKILFVGRLVEFKGPEMLLQSVHILIQQYKQVPNQVSMVGEGDKSYVDFLAKKVQTLNLEPYIKFFPPVSRKDLRDIYVSHTLLVFPSLWNEPFSITLLEAMACGIPIISTDTGGSKEILKNEENCLLFEKKSSQDLADKIDRLLRDSSLRKRLTENAFETIKEYSLDKMADKIENYLKGILENKVFI